jgi:glutamate racemase
VARILVFDSGVGGLSILRAIQSQAGIHSAEHQWLFCSDNAFFPYGTKKEAELLARVSHVLTCLQAQYHPDIIVLACNTASTLALETVRAILSVPVIGVVPAIKPAAALSESRCIGLLATPATIARPYTQQLIDDFAQDCNIVRLGTSELVSMAEDLLRSGIIDQGALHRILSPFRDAIAHHHMDTVVLACTHFPLLSESLREQLPEIKHWVDSGAAIARRVAWQLEQRQETNADAVVDAPIALFTRLDEPVKKLARALSHFKCQDIRQLELPDTTT